MGEYIEAIRGGTLPTDSYSFYKVEGTQIATDFGTSLRELFGRVLADQDPELSQLAATVPNLAGEWGGALFCSSTI
jgi:hypothetical protein